MRSIGRLQQEPHEFLIAAYWGTVRSGRGAVGDGGGKGLCWAMFHLPEHDLWLSSQAFDSGYADGGQDGEFGLPTKGYHPLAYLMPIEWRATGGGQVAYPELQVSALLRALLSGEVGHASTGDVEVAYMEPMGEPEQDDDGVYSCTYRVGLWGSYWGVALNPDESLTTVIILGF